MTQGGARIGISMAWSGGGAALMRLSQLLVGVIAARLLTEHDFGVYAVALVAYSVIVNVSDLGVSSALIREHDALDRLAPTAVSLSLVTALALAGVMFVAAPFLADAMGVPDGVTAIQVLALVVLLGGPGAVPAALLTRDFRQDVRFWADLANFFIGNAVMIPLALAGWGALALAWSRVVGQVCSVVILLAAAPRRYRPGFDPTVARELLTFGGPLVGSRMAGLALSSVDVVTLGRMQGAVPLGRYALASNVSSWPLGLLEPVLINVGLPLVSRLRRSQEQLRSFVELSVAATAGVFFLISATIAALAEPLVLALYTAKWADAIPILSVLALAGFVRVFLTPFADVLIACQATRAQMFVHLAWLVALIPATIVGVSLAGPLGAAYAQLGVVTLIVVPLTLAVVRRVAGTPLRAALATAIHPLLSGSAAAVGAYGVSRLLPDPWLALLAGGLTSVAIYLLTTHRWLRDHLARARALASTVTIDAAPADLTTVAASGRGRPRPAVHRPRPLSGEPTVSVVIPCFNYARYVPEAVGSVLEQRGVVVDIIIVDDCSTDDSLAVARGLADEHPQVQVLANAVNAGPVATFNRGLAQARGEFLVRLDADDLLTPGLAGSRRCPVPALPWRGAGLRAPGALHRPAPVGAARTGAPLAGLARARLAAGHLRRRPQRDHVTGGGDALQRRRPGRRRGGSALHPRHGALAADRRVLRCRLRGGRRPGPASGSSRQPLRHESGLRLGQDRPPGRLRDPVRRSGEKHRRGVRSAGARPPGAGRGGARRRPAGTRSGQAGRRRDQPRAARVRRQHRPLGGGPARDP